jgi:hypothetical protein
MDALVIDDLVMDDLLLISCRNGYEGGSGEVGGDDIRG